MDVLDASNGMTLYSWEVRYLLQWHKLKISFVYLRVVWYYQG